MLVLKKIRSYIKKDIDDWDLNNNDLKKKNTV